MRLIIIVTTAIFCITHFTLAAKDYKETEDIINIILSEKNPAVTIKNIPQETDAIAETSVKEKKAKNVSKPSASDPAYVFLKNGITYYNNSMFGNALAQFSELTKEFPQSQLVDQANVWKGKSLIRQYKYTDAISALSSIPKESGEYPTAIFYSAEAYASSGRHLKAIELYQQVASIFPTDPQADNALLRAGHIYLNDKNGRNALESAISLIKYYSDRETIDDAYYLLGKVFERDEILKDLEISRKIYKIFLKKSASGEPHFNTSPLTQSVKQDLHYIEKKYLFIGD